MACSGTALPFLISPNVGGRLVSTPATCSEFPGSNLSPGRSAFCTELLRKIYEHKEFSTYAHARSYLFLLWCILQGFTLFQEGYRWKCLMLPRCLCNPDFLHMTSPKLRNIFPYILIFWELSKLNNIPILFKIGLPWRALPATFLEANGASNPEAASVTAVTMDAVLSQPESSWHRWRYSERLGRILGNVPKTNIFIQILVCQRAFEMALFLRLAVSMKRREQPNESWWKSVFESSAKFCW
jgi:hypothetical protein